VDDGSTDNSGRICEKFAKEDSRIRVVHKKNSGVSDARNTGLDIAQGEYICFVDSDDTIKSEYLKYLLALLKEDTEASVAVCAICFASKENHVSDNKIQICNTAEALNTIFYENEKFGVYVWNKIFKAELFDGIRFPSGQYYEESAVIYQLFGKSLKVVFGSLPQYVYNDVREGSIINTYSHKKYLDKIGFLKEMEEYIKANYPDAISGYYKFSSFSYAAMLRNLSGHYHEVKDYKDNAKRYKKELSHVIFKVFLDKKIKLKKKISMLFWYLLPVDLASNILTHRSGK
jgi:glycosyltransferase involved in cell wall biosynthesis